MPITLIAAEDDEGRRLDRILRKALPDLPLSAIHRLLRKSAVQVDGEKAGGEARVKKGQIIKIAMETPPEGTAASLHLKSSQGGGPPAKSSKGQKTAESGKTPDSFTLEILFEGSGLLIVNKPRGLAVHGGSNSGGKNPSLQNYVIPFLSPKLPHSLSFKPGPLHRLDKGTSGIIVFSTSLEGAHF
ncbi:MAG: pseudouridine synthase, partial [Treponema sp.]|nr:pseudouridine synthase [Treponema sp.]